MSSITESPFQVPRDDSKLLQTTKTSAIEYKKQISFLFRCAATSALGSLMLGYDQGIISGALVPIENHFKLSEFQAEMMTSSITFTSIIGSFIAGSIADALGRKAALMIASMIFFAGSLGMGLAMSYFTLITWRCISGIGVGMGLVICPMYCAELSPKSMRGSLTSFNEMFINVGIPLAYLANLLLSGTSPDDWRYMLISGCLPALGLLLATCVLPESPRWLIKHGKPEQAEAIIKKFIHPSESEDVVRRVCKEVMSDMRRDMETRVLRDSIEEYTRPRWTLAAFVAPASDEVASWLDVFRRNRKVAFTGMTFAVFQQAIGTDAILLYSVRTLTVYGVSNETALLTTLVMGICKLTFTIFTSTLVDNPSIGRRKPLLVGGSGVFCGCCIIAISGAFPSSTGSGLIAGFLVFMSSFGFSYGPLCWLILAELFKGQNRSKALSLGSVLNRLTSFMVTSVYLSCLRWFTLTGTFVGFAVIALAALIFSAVSVPELAGRRLGSAAHSSVMSRNLSCISAQSWGMARAPST